MCLNQLALLCMPSRICTDRSLGSSVEHHTFNLRLQGSCGFLLESFVPVVMCPPQLRLQHGRQQRQQEEPILQHHGFHGGISQQCPE